MGVINFIILSFLSAVFILTLNKINCDFGARNFLENITYLPNEPVTSTVLIFNVKIKTAERKDKMMKFMTPIRILI